MNRRRKLHITALLLLVGLGLYAQENDLSTLRESILVPDTTWQQLDSLALYAPSVRIFRLDGKILPDSGYELLGNTIRFRQPATEQVRVQYRVLPTPWLEEQLRIDSQDITTGYEEPLLIYDPFETPESPLLDFQGMNYRGNFTRGLSFGNNQNLVLNSSFNLQMNGLIGDGIEVSAAISDENIPIQPEGTTQQLNEFDRIFIQLRKDSTRLIAGDYDLLRPDGYFMNHYKRLQGLSVETTSLDMGKGTLDLRGSVAISRGKFNRMVFMGQEGNQGPYRLLGAEGETFIIVLAGTEKVFVDGQLMERGLDADYIINYNTGEITFMPRRLITKDLRIIFEFEYSDQNYLRWLYAAGADYQTEKTRLYLNVYSEQDGRSTVGDTDLSEAEREALRLAGDNPLETVFPGIDSLTEESIDPITYRLIDTTVSGQLYPNILLFTPDTTAEDQLYTARFSDLGEGNGNYIRPASDANGLVYVWVAPDAAGNPQGRYEPVTRLVAPNQRQLFTAGVEHRISENASLRGEVALSRRDENRFSNLNSGDDLGLATYLEYKQRIRLGRAWKLDTRAAHEVLHQNFRPLNPYRVPEFQRDWNIAQFGDRPEHWGRAGFQLASDSLNTQLNYQFNGFWRLDRYEGRRHIANWSLQEAGWSIDLNADHLQSEANTENSRFWRPRARIEHRFAGLADWTVGAFYEAENNRRTDPVADTLLQSSFAFAVYRAYLRSPERDGFRTEFSVQYRTDDMAGGRDFKRFTEAWDTRFEGSWQAIRSLRLGWQFHYRRLFLTEPTDSNLEAGDTYAGQTNMGLNLFKDAFRYSADYRVSSGQEQKILFVFRPVNQGEGVYQHIDFNDDGVEQNDEFVIAANQDQATHIRVVVYTNEFIRTNNVQLFQSLLFDPRKWWFEEKGVKGFLAKFSSQTSWQTNRKVRQLPEISGWNPFTADLADTALVSTLSNLQQNIFFNQIDPVYGLQYTITDNQNKTLLTTGFQSRRRREHLVLLRWNIGQMHSIRIRAAQGIETNQLDSDASQQYELAFRRIEPEWNFLPNNDFRTALSYRFETGEDQLPGSDVRAIFHEGKLEVRYNQAATTFLSTSVSFVRINFNGVADSAVGFALLEGLQNGNNFRWNVSLDRQLARNLRLNLSYEGRKTGAASVVHTGRAQVSAVF